MATVDPAIPPRVKRLISGQAGFRDLDRIFQWARSRSFGNRAVKDVGDFAAHREEKNAGITWAATRNFTISLRFHMYKLKEPERIDINHFNDAAWSNFNRLEQHEFSSIFGLSKSKVKMHLKNALAKVEQIAQGKFAPRIQYSEVERRILDYMITRLLSRPIFTQDQIAEELSTCLRQNGLITDAQKKDIVNQSDLIALFAIETLHGAKILFSKDDFAWISADEYEDKITLHARTPMPMSWGTFDVSFPLVLTNLVWNRHCDETVPRRISHDQAIEFTQEGKLTLI